MSDQDTIFLAPNGYGAQPYISRDLLGDSGCPLDPGDTCIGHAIPGVGILLVDASDPRTFDVVPQPNREESRPSTTSEDTTPGGKPRNTRSHGSE